MVKASVFLDFFFALMCAIGYRLKKQRLASIHRAWWKPPYEAPHIDGKLLSAWGKVFLQKVGSEKTSGECTAIAWQRSPKSALLD
jgi:hypothetical protein